MEVRFVVEVTAALPGALALAQDFPSSGVRLTGSDGILAEKRGDV
jgi:hypothetical protein